MTSCDLCGGNTAFPIYIDRHEFCIEVCEDCYKKYNEGKADWIEYQLEDR